MTEASATTRLVAGRAEAPPARRRFNVDEYYRMAKAGILGPDERVELLGGDIYTIAAMGSRHAGCTGFLNRWFSRRLSGRAIVRVQVPIHISSGAEPEPDLALVRLRSEDPDYYRAHPGPGDVLLLIEIADSSLAYDRDLKLPLYAAAGVAEAWLVDLTTSRVQVHRGPSTGGYRSVTIHGRDSTLTPAAFPDLHLSVAELLPA